MFISKQLNVVTGVAVSVFTAAMVILPFVSQFPVVGGWWGSSVWWVWRGGW